MFGAQILLTISDPSAIVAPVTAGIFVAYAVLCNTAICRTRRSSLTVLSRSRPEPVLLETVPSLYTDFYQQLLTVDTFLPNLSAITGKESPISHSPITQLSSNSLSC